MQHWQIFSLFLIFCYYFKISCKTSCKIWETWKIFPILHSAPSDNNYAPSDNNYLCYTIKKYRAENCDLFQVNKNYLLEKMDQKIVINSLILEWKLPLILRPFIMGHSREKTKEGRLRPWNFQGYRRNTMWNFQGLIKRTYSFKGLSRKKWGRYSRSLDFGLGDVTKLCGISWNDGLVCSGFLREM